MANKSTRSRQYLIVLLTLVLGVAPGVSAEDDLDALLDEPAEREEAAIEATTTESPEATAPQSSTKPNRRVIEEMVVTAQKREQAMQDVPISMSALEEDFLNEQGITNIGEAMLLVPNVQIGSAGWLVTPSMRGFSYNIFNKAFEPPVGIVVDNVPFTRIPYFTSALFDTQRVEVLRGPQGTNFGKNTTAGLIHLISNKPSADQNGSVSIQYGELERQRLEAAYGGPLTGNWNFRVAGLFDTRDGFIRNTSAAVVPTAPEELKDRDRKGIRASLQSPDIWGGELTLSLESIHQRDGGVAGETLSSGQNFQEFVRTYDPGADFIPGNYVASLEFPGFRDLSINTLRGEWETGIGEWDSITILAHSVLEQTFSDDIDFSPVPAFEARGADTSPTSFFETRLVSPQLPGLLGLDSIFGWQAGSSYLVAGLVYEERGILDSFFRFGINTVPLLGITVATELDANGVPPPSTLLDPLTALGLPGLADLPINPTDTDALYEQMAQNFEQKARSIGVYANWQWEFTETLGLELGARYTEEKKNGWWNLVFETLPPNAMFTLLGFQEFTAAVEREEQNVQPKVSFNYKPTDELSIFLHWEKGFKGGGFNAFAYRNAPEDNLRDLVYEEENSDNYGLDFKTSLFDGAARLNVSFFHQKAHDFQVLVRNNPPGTISLGTTAIANAPEALSEGIEADLTWLATDWLTVISAIGYNHTEYLDFEDNECPAGRANEDGDDNPRCDATGKQFPFAPELTGTLTLNTHGAMAGMPWIGHKFGSVEWVVGTTIEYQSDQLLDLDLDERKRQDSFYRYKANLGLRNPAKGWSLRLIGENLTNEATHIRMEDVFTDVIVGTQNEPRLWYLQFQQDF